MNSNNQILNRDVGLGDYYGGGYVVITGDTLYIMSPYDCFYMWGCNGVSTYATGTTIGLGQINTNLIIAACADSAAKICEDYELAGYADWFMPCYYEMKSAFEITTKEENKFNFNLTTTLRYWTASEYSSTVVQSLRTDVWGGQLNVSNKGRELLFRPFRKTTIN